MRKYVPMKKFALLLCFCFFSLIASAQTSATNFKQFSYHGKTYTGTYDPAKHVLTFNREVSFEIYDETGTCVKRGKGIKADFSSLLKKGEEEKTFTVQIYRKTKKRGDTIRQKGTIGTMVIADSK